MSMQDLIYDLFGGGCGTNKQVQYSESERIADKIIEQERIKWLNAEKLKSETNNRNN